MDVPGTQTAILLFALLLGSGEDFLHLVLWKPQPPLQLGPVEPPQLPLGLGLVEGAAGVQLVREAAVEARPAADVIYIPK